MFRTWKPRLTAWGPAGSRPNSSTSSMWESDVSGCQAAAWVSLRLNAQPTLRALIPERTMAFFVT